MTEAKSVIVQARAVTANAEVPKGVAELAASITSLLSYSADYYNITTQEGLSKGTEMLAQLRKARTTLEGFRSTMKAPALQMAADVDGQFVPTRDALDTEIEMVNRGVTARMSALKKIAEEEERVRREVEAKKLREEEAERRRVAEEARTKAEAERVEAQRKLDEAAELDRQGRKTEAEAALKASQDAEARQAVATQDAAIASQEAAGAATAAENVVAAPLEVPTVVTGALGARVGLKMLKKWRIKDITKVPEQYLVDPEERVNRSLITATRNAGQPINGIEYYEEASTSTRAGRI